MTGAAGRLVAAALLLACASCAWAAQAKVSPLAASIATPRPAAGLAYGAVKPSPEPKPTTLPTVGWKCATCMDTARALHQLHGLVEDSLPATMQQTRTSASSVDLGVRFGCAALPFEERTACHAVRYAIGSNDAKSFEALAFAFARDSRLKRLLPSHSTLEEEEIDRFAKVLQDAGFESLEAKEKEFVEAVALRRKVDEAADAAANVFEACKRMTMCDAEDEAEGCGVALESTKCVADGACVIAGTVCKPRCRHCAWVLRSWPAWIGQCAALVDTSRKVEVGSSTAKLPAAKADAPIEGPFSPPMEESLLAKPPTEGDLRRHCLAMSWAMQDLVDAEAVVAGTGGEGGQQMRGPWPWSPALACTCLGQCPYSSMDAFRLRDAGCLGPSAAREAEAWERRHEEEPAAEGRLRRAAAEQEQLADFERRWFRDASEFEDMRVVAKRTALELKGREQDGEAGA